MLVFLSVGVSGFGLWDYSFRCPRPRDDVASFIASRGPRLFSAKMCTWGVGQACRTNRGEIGAMLKHKQVLQSLM